MATITAPTWVDLSAGDVTAEQDFYADVLGWTFDEPHPDAGGWRQARAGGAQAAGMQPRPPGGMPFSAWTVYFGTDDIEGAIGQAAALGATPLMPPMPVVIGGELMTTIVMLADPAGAIFGLSQPGVHTGFGARGPGPKVPDGTPVWFELMARDARGAAEFYAALLGAQIKQAPDAAIEYFALSLDGTEFAGIGGFPDAAPGDVPPYWSPYFAVSDVDGAVERATAAGATVLMGPADLGPGRLAMFLDPENAAFNVLSVTVGSPE
jgi:predicted enzyme related to lactoylglutathione lyase